MHCAETSSVQAIDNRYNILRHSLQFLCRYIGMITKYDCQHTGKLACNQNTFKENDLDLILFVCNISGFPLFLYTTIFLNIAAA